MEYGHRGPRGCEATSPVQIGAGSVVRQTIQQARHWAHKVQRPMGSWRWEKASKKRQSLSQALKSAEKNELEEIKRHAG